MQSPAKAVSANQLSISIENLDVEGECLGSELSTQKANVNIASFSPQRLTEFPRHASGTVALNGQDIESEHEGTMSRAGTAAATHTGGGSLDILSPAPNAIYVQDFSSGISFDEGTMATNKNSHRGEVELNDSMDTMAQKNWEEFGALQPYQTHQIQVNGNYDKNMSMIEESDYDVNTISASNTLSNSLGRPVAPLSSEKLDSFNSHFNPSPSPIITRYICSHSPMSPLILINYH